MLPGRRAGRCRPCRADGGDRQRSHPHQAGRPLRPRPGRVPAVQQRGVRPDLHHPVPAALDGPTGRDRRDRPRPHPWRSGGPRRRLSQLPPARSTLAMRAAATQTCRPSSACAGRPPHGRHRPRPIPPGSGSLTSRSSRHASNINRARTSPHNGAGPASRHRHAGTPPASRQGRAAVTPLRRVTRPIMRSRTIVVSMVFGAGIGLVVPTLAVQIGEQSQAGCGGARPRCLPASPSPARSWPRCSSALSTRPPPFRACSSPPPPWLGPCSSGWRPWRSACSPDGCSTLTRNWSGAGLISCGM